MAELSSQERLFPSLLDRLTDDAPSQQVESRDRRVFSLSKLRDAVLRDLVWLLNTTHLQATEDFRSVPLVANSVINYGIPDLTGRSVSGLEVVDLQRTIRQAILNFEPRILADTLEVRGQANEEKGPSNSLTFEIEGELWARPIPERLFLRTELDLETGSVAINEV